MYSTVENRSRSCDSTLIQSITKHVVYSISLSSQLVIRVVRVVTECDKKKIVGATATSRLFIYPFHR